MNITNPDSKHFTVQEITEGIYAIIAIDGGAAICNSSIVDLGNHVIIFDTFQTPQAALDLRKLVFTLFGNIQTTVVNSHWHDDHIWGNQVFIDVAHIVSSSRTRQLIASKGPEVAEQCKGDVIQQLNNFRSQFQKADGDQRRDLKLWLGMYEGLAEDIPHFSLCLPDISFDKHLTLYGSKRTAELIEFENGHTESDIVLYLPQEGVVFMSDLLFVGCHPYLGDGDPIGQQTALRKIGELKAKYFIPGHGPLGRPNDLVKLIHYIDHCTETAQNLVSKGGEYKERIAKLKVPKPYQDWKVSSFFVSNINSLCKRINPAARE